MAPVLLQRVTIQAKRSASILEMSTVMAAGDQVSKLAAAR